MFPQTYVESSLELTGVVEVESGGSAAATKAKMVKQLPVKLRKDIQLKFLTYTFMNTHIHKKKWSGLQGDILKKKKDSDLGK